MQQGYKQRVIDFFNSRTAYDSKGDEHPNEAQRLLDYVPLTSGQSVLDIATGTGLLADIPEILAKCYRWLKPQGYFAFSTPDCNSHLATLKVRLSQELFGIDLPHIIRPLWSPEKCLSLLQQAGFRNIEIERNQYSRSRITKNTGLARIENDFYPRGNPLQSLSKAEKQLLQSEFQKAVDRLVVEQGVWQEANNLYVKARK